MLYLTRTSEGEIISLTTQKAKGAEPADLAAKDVQAFLKKQGLNGSALVLQSLEETDVALIRVLEDLIEALIQKNILTVSDLPKEAISKLSGRRSLRTRLAELNNLVGSDDPIL